MKYLKVVLFLSLLLAQSALLQADVLKPKLEKISQKIAGAAEAKGLAGATLAVFPLQADEKLEKKRVNFATGEILSYYLLKTGKFKMVERSQLEGVMKEQKLGLSGAVDSKTAAGIGQLVGAKLLVLGNVIKMGDSYQITVKLVDAETSEMISVEMTEVPVETFDKEASSYLVLVPDHQAIGIFLGSVYGATPVVKSEPWTHGTLTLTPNNMDKFVSKSGFCLGIRYWFKPKYVFQLDLSFIGAGTQDGKFFTTNGTVVGKDYNSGPGYTGQLIRGSVSRTGKLSSAFNWNAGVGMGFYSVNPIDDTGEEQTHYTVGGTDYYLWTKQEGMSFSTPFIRAGIEWKPQARFGWNLSANWNALSKTYERKVSVRKNFPLTSEDGTLWRSKFPSIYFDTSVALYF